jgi:hypothetical protein
MVEMVVFSKYKRERKKKREKRTENLHGAHLKFNAEHSSLPASLMCVPMIGIFFIFFILSYVSLASNPVKTVNEGLLYKQLHKIFPEHHIHA